MGNLDALYYCFLNVPFPIFYLGDLIFLFNNFSVVNLITAVALLICSCLP